MKLSCLLIGYLFIFQTALAGLNIDSIDKQLNHAVQNKEYYSKQKEGKIAALKKLNIAGLSLIQQYQLNQSLYQEYKKFKIDSAIYYVNQNLSIAGAINDKELKSNAQIQLANLYSSSGKPREAEILLKGIQKQTLSRAALLNYYDIYSQFFEHYATNSYNEAYIKQVEIYRDSLVRLLNPVAIQYQINQAQQLIYNRQTSAARKELLNILKSLPDTSADYAMVTYLLGNVYEIEKDITLQKAYYTLAATADIKNAIKDNAAIQNLALIYYQSGDIDRAYRYTNSAIEDAIFCNVQFRTLRMSGLYAIINTAYLAKESRQKSQLQTYLILISLLSLFFAVAVVIVYRQKQRVSKITEELHATSQKLAELNKSISQTNQQLYQTNAQLTEANQVKEAYITQFFNLCSTYINKLENYRKTLNKKAGDKQLDELFKMLRSTTIVDNEVEELYVIFDHIFLKLYPTFVTDFNALLIKEDQIALKPTELLNTELRIFALIRLGITDSVKIAAFLRYSLSTIYNYRTRTRNKAAVSRNEFEEMVIKIGSLPTS